MGRNLVRANWAYPNSCSWSRVIKAFARCTRKSNSFPVRRVDKRRYCSFYEDLRDLNGMNAKINDVSQLVLTDALSTRDSRTKD